MHYVTLPYLDRRDYVHSSSYVNYILDLFPSLNAASFYFPKVTRGSIHILQFNTKPIHGNAHGVVDGIYFAFNNADMFIDIPVVQVEPKTRGIIDIKRDEFIWNTVAHFRESYTDHNEGQPVIAKIELKNFDSIVWPAEFEFNRKYTQTRTSCSFRYNGIEVCKQIGIVSK